MSTTVYQDNGSTTVNKHADVSVHKQAAVTLARAFQYDPFMHYLMPDELKRATTLPWFMATVVRYCHRFGEVHVTPECNAVACWLTPGNTSVTSTRFLQVGGALMPFKLGASGFTKLNAFQSHLRKEHAEHAADPHYYLYMLGADPLSRGKGLARRLLKPILERADQEGKAAYLETQNEKNVAVYNKIGFEVVSSGKVATSDLTVWSLRREPRPIIASQSEK